jgi:hypothetical protein
VSLNDISAWANTEANAISALKNRGFDSRREGDARSRQQKWERKAGSGPIRIGRAFQLGMHLSRLVRRREWRAGAA